MFLAEIPLLYETEGEGRFDAVISVLADPALCQKRFMQQTREPIQEFEKRMTRQIEPILKANKAHYTIENNGDLEELKIKIKTLYFQLTEE